MNQCFQDFFIGFIIVEHLVTIIYIYIFKVSRLADYSRGEGATRKFPFQLLQHRGVGGHYFFLGITPLFP